MMDPHPMEAPEVLYKEPDETASFQFDFTDSQQLAAGETVSTIDSTSITPAEEHHRLTFSSLTGGPFHEGEAFTASGGVTGSIVNATKDGDGSVDIYVAATATIASGATLTGAVSGAVVTVSEAKAVGTRQAQSPQLSSSQVDGKLAEVTLTDGLRPLAGAPRREYVVRVVVTTSASQSLVGIGRLHVPEAAEANNP